jgi:hypothetical protein
LTGAEEKIIQEESFQGGSSWRLLEMKNMIFENK